MNHLRIFVFAATLAAASAVGAADKVYKWRAEDGSVVFSDEAPGSKSDQTETLDMPESQLLGDPSSAAPQKQSPKQTESLAKQRILQRKRLQEELELVSGELTLARQAYQAGKTPKEGETQRLAGGRTKLSQSYFDRLKQEEQQIKSLEARVSAIREALLKLR